MPNKLAPPLRKALAIVAIIGIIALVSGEPALVFLASTPFVSAHMLGMTAALPHPMLRIYIRQKIMLPVVFSIMFGMNAFNELLFKIGFSENMLLIEAFQVALLLIVGLESYEIARKNIPGQESDRGDTS